MNSLPHPPWHPRYSETRFRKWVIDRLQEHYRRDPDDAQLLPDEVGRKLCHQIQRAKIHLADRKKELAAILRLTGHKHGRVKGEARPSDLDPLTKQLLKNASDEVFVIRQIVESHWSRSKGCDAIAMQIAAERHFVTVDQLRNYRKK